MSPTPTHPANAGNRARVYALLEAMETLGLDFHFAFIAWENADVKAMQQRWGEHRVSIISQRFTQNYSALWRRIRNRALRTLRLECHHPLEVDCYRSPGLQLSIEELARKIQPDCVMVEYVFNSWMLDLFPPTVRKVLDTHDKFANRYEYFLKAGLQPEWFSTTRRQERKGLLRADCVIAIQEIEADYFRRLTGQPVVTLGHICQPHPMPKKPGEEQSILYVGSNNQANQDAMAVCLKEIWPAIRRECPAAQLLVAGKICENISKPPPGVKLCGQQDNLDELYAAAHVVINPMRTGTGLKIKCLEALSYGKPLVTTPAGAEGLESAAGTVFLVGSNAAMLAAHCITLLQNQEKRLQLAGKALDFVRAWNARNYAALREAIGAS